MPVCMQYPALPENSLYTCRTICHSVCVPTYLSVCLSVCLSGCLAECVSAYTLAAHVAFIVFVQQIHYERITFVRELTTLFCFKNCSSWRTSKTIQTGQPLYETTGAPFIRTIGPGY